MKHTITCAWICCWCRFCLCWWTEVLQWNALNRNISIAVIVFILNLVCKTVYHYLGIITTTQHTLNQSTIFNDSRFMLPQWYVPIMRTSGRWNDIFNVYISPSLQVILLCIVLRVEKNQDNTNTGKIPPFHPVGVFYTLNILWWGDKHEIVLEGMLLIWILTLNINMWEIRTTTQHIFLVW